MDQGTKRYNRKTTQLDYLNREIQQLKDHIENLEYQQQLNKAQLQIALSIPQNGNSNNQKQQNIHNSQQEQQNQQSYQQLIQALQEENQLLLQDYQNVIAERDEAQGRNLVMEQMYEAAEKQKKELIADLTENQNRLQNKLKEADIKIHELEKNNIEIDDITGVVIQYRDVVSFNDQTKCLHFELEKMNAFISTQNKELKFLREQREEILRINITLNQQIQRQKQQLDNFKNGLQTKTEASSPVGRPGILSTSERQNFEMNQQQLFPAYVDPDQEYQQNQESFRTDQMPSEQQIQLQIYQQMQENQGQNNQQEQQEQVQKANIKQGISLNLNKLKDKQENQNQGLQEEQQSIDNQKQQQEINDKINQNQENLQEMQDQNNQNIIQSKQKVLPNLQIPLDAIKQQPDNQNQQLQQQNLQQKVPALNMNLNLQGQQQVQQELQVNQQINNQDENQDQYNDYYDGEDDDDDDDEDYPYLDDKVQNPTKKPDFIQLQQNQELQQQQQQQQEQIQNIQLGLSPNNQRENNQNQINNNGNTNNIKQEDLQDNKEVKEMIKFVQHFNKNEDESDKSNDSYEENLPDKVQYNLNTQQDDNELPQNENREQQDQKAKLNLKPLNLKKAQEIQKKTVDKQMQQEAQKYLQQNGINLQPYIERIYKLDQRLEKAGKNMAKELLKNKNLSKENEDLNRLNSELEQRNETLINSQKLYEQKWQKYHYQFKSYEQFYRQYRSQIQYENGIDLPSQVVYNDKNYYQEDESGFINYNLTTTGERPDPNMFNSQQYSNNNQQQMYQEHQQYNNQNNSNYQQDPQYYEQNQHNNNQY